METESLLTEFEISLLRGLQAAQMQRSTRCTSDNTEFTDDKGTPLQPGGSGPAQRHVQLCQAEWSWRRETFHGA